MNQKHEERKEGLVPYTNIKSTQKQNKSAAKDVIVSLKSEFQIAKQNGLIIRNYNNIENYQPLAIGNVAVKAIEQKKHARSQYGLHYYGKIHYLDSSRGFVAFCINGNVDYARFIIYDVYIDGISIDQSLLLHDVLYVGMPVELYVTKFKSGARSEGKIVKYKAEYVGCHPVYFGVIADVHCTTGFIQFLKGNTYEKAFFQKDLVWIDGKKIDSAVVSEVLKRNSPVILLVEYYDDKTDVKFKAFFVTPLPQLKNENMSVNIQACITEPSHSKNLTSEMRDRSGLTGFVVRYVFFDKGIVRTYIDGMRHELYFTLYMVKVPLKFANLNLQDCIPVNSTVYFDVICSDKEKYEISSLWFGRKSECVPLYRKTPATVTMDCASFPPLVESNMVSSKLPQSVPEKIIATVSPSVRDVITEENVRCMKFYENGACREKVKHTNSEIFQHLGTIQSFLSDDLGVLSYNYHGVNISMPFHKNVVSFPANKRNIMLRNYLQIGQQVYFNGHFLYPNDESALVFTKLWPVEEISSSFWNNNLCKKEIEVSETSCLPDTSKKAPDFSDIFKTPHPTVYQSHDLNKKSVLQRKVLERGNNEESVNIFNKVVLKGVINYVLDDIGVLTGSKTEELGFTRETVFLFGVPLQNYNLQAIFREGDTVEYIFDSGIGIKKVWLGCDVATDTERSFTELLTFCEDRKIQPFIVDLLIKDYDGLYLSKRDENKELCYTNDVQQEEYIGACSNNFNSRIECTKHDNKALLYEESIKKHVLPSVEHESFSISDDSSEYRSIAGDSSVYESATECFEENFGVQHISAVANPRENGKISFDSDEYTPNTGNFGEEKSLSNCINILSVKSLRDCDLVSETLSDPESVSTIENMSVSDLDVENTFVVDSFRKHISSSDLHLYTSDSGTSSDHGSITENHLVTDRVTECNDAIDNFQHVLATKNIEEDECVPEYTAAVNRFEDVSVCGSFSEDEYVNECLTEHVIQHIPYDNTSVNHVSDINACRESSVEDISTQHSSFAEIPSLALLCNKKISEGTEHSLNETNGNSSSENFESDLQSSVTHEIKFQDNCRLEKDENDLGIYLSDSDDDDCYQYIYSKSDTSLQAQSEHNNEQDEPQEFMENRQPDDHSTDAAANHLLSCSENVDCFLLCERKENSLKTTVVKPGNHSEAPSGSIPANDAVCQIFDSNFIVMLKSLLEKKFPDRRMRNDSSHLFADSVIKHMSNTFFDLICEMLKDALSSELEDLSSFTDEVSSITKDDNSKMHKMEELDKQMLINEVVEDFKKTVLGLESGLALISGDDKQPKRTTSMETQTISTGSVVHTHLLTDEQ